MGYFPFFIDIADRKCLIVGGGNVAARKLEKITGFGADITVVSPEICSSIRNYSVNILERRFNDTDLDGVFMVIAATNDRKLNRHIHDICTERRILVNTVDEADNCNFFFPALVHKNDITVGISTGGKCPVMAGFLRSVTDNEINDKILACADILSRYRSLVKEKLPTEKKRSKAMKALLDLCMNSISLPDYDDIINLMEVIDNNETENRNSQE